MVSSESGKRFHVSDLSVPADRNSSDLQSKIHVRLDQKFQTILGWGGAFTDSTALNVYNLSRSISQKLIESYFGAEGLQYNFGRVPMGGSDFSTRAYTYADVKDDFELKHWALAIEDTGFKIPMIKEAMRLCERQGEPLKLFGSPWSPPVWMKESNNILNGHLKGDDRTYKSWSDYLIKFYKAYREHGIEFWGQTLENEPIQNWVSTINALEFNSTEQIRFVTKFFGPALEANGMGRDNFQLMLGDDSLNELVPQVPDVMNNPEAAKYFSGLAFHWYDSGNGANYDDLNKIYETIKDKIDFVLMTEACSGNNKFSKKPLLGSWERGDTYAMDIIEDLLRHTSGWIDWNMALNRAGGPNWATNLMDAPIIVNEEADEFYKQPMYYAIGHFSRFFRPGSVRVSTTVDTKQDIRVVAVRNDFTGHLSVNILNRSFRDQQVELTINDGSKYEPLTIDLETRSLTSVVLKM